MVHLGIDILGLGAFAINYLLDTSGYRNYNAPKPSQMPALKAAIDPLLTP